MPLQPSLSENSHLQTTRTDYICYTLILLFSGVTYFSSIWDLDFFWQLATGRWISANGALPQVDPFGVYPGATAERAQLILKGYWLCQLIYFWLYSALGYTGLALLKAAVFAALFLGQFRFLRKTGTGTAIAAVQFLLVYSEFLAFRADRPQIFGYIGVLLIISLTELRNPRWLPLVMILWANIHGSFLVGFAIIGVYTAFETVRLIRKRGNSPSPVGWYLAALAAAAINPTGLNSLVNLITSPVSVYEKTVFEYTSPLDLALKYNDIYWGYFLVLLAGTVLIITRWKRLPPEQMAVFSVIALFSLTGGRYIPFLVVCGSIYTALWLASLPDKLADSRILTTSAFILVAVLAIFDINNGRGFSQGVEKDRFPVKAVEFLNSMGISGYTYCNPYWGGYALWAAPGRKISSDSRALSINEYLRDLNILGDHSSFDKFRAAGYDTVLTAAFNPISGEKHILWQLLANSPEWRLAYSDTTALVFVKKGKEPLSASDSAGRVLDHALKQATFFTVKFPDTTFHWINLAEIYLLRHEPALAAAAFRAALKRDPANPEIANRLLLLERGIY